MALGTLAPGDLSITGGQVKIVPLGITIDPNRARPEHSAPEVAAGGAPSPAGDLYAAGLLAFELFAGRPPFPGGAARGGPPDASALEPSRRSPR